MIVWLNVNSFIRITQHPYILIKFSRQQDRPRLFLFIKIILIYFFLILVLNI